MKILLPCVAVGLLSSAVRAQSDDCLAALPITGTGAFPFTTVGATSSADLPSCTNLTSQLSADAWFAWTPGVTGNYRLKICAASHDVILSLRESCGGAELGCDDLDGCGQGSFESAELLLPALSGATTYLIQIDGWDGATGSGVLEIESTVAPSNDTCATAAPIAGFGATPFSTFDATPGVPPPCAQGIGLASADVWFEWTSGVAGDYRFQVCQADYDVTVALYDACDGALLGCDESLADCGPVVESVQVDLFGVAPNTTYLVQLDGWDGAMGTGTLEVLPVPGPVSNDDCSAALSLDGTGVFPFDTANGVTTDGIPDASCLFAGQDQIENDVWYRWTAPAAANYDVSTCSLAGLDTKLAVYVDSTCPVAGPLRCSDDDCDVGLQSLVTISASAGDVFLIRLGSYPGVPGGTGSFSILEKGSPLPLGTSFCTSLANSSGGAAQIFATGSESVAEGLLALTAVDLPASVNGLFFYGTAQLQAPFGNGLRCAGGLVQRLPVVGADAQGTLSDPDVFVHSMTTNPIGPGTLYFQAWFRDAAQGAASTCRMASV